MDHSTEIFETRAYTTKEALRIQGIAAQQCALSLGPVGRNHLLSSALGSPTDFVRFTVWSGGRTDTTGGQRQNLPFQEFTNLLFATSCEVFAKGEGPWMAPGWSTNCRCRDQDLEGITMLALDCDGAGNWHEGIAILESVGLSFLVQRSVSHTDMKPKFHVFIPLEYHWFGTKHEWRHLYRFLGVFFSIVFNFLIDPSSDPPIYGFDPATDRLLQPFFLATRRQHTDLLPEMRYHRGRSLDLGTLLNGAGFQVLSPPARRPRRRALRVPPVPPLPVFGAHESLGVIGLAFLRAGWAGGMKPGRKLVVRCPWESSHSTGVPFDGSTVLFLKPGMYEDVFWCSHAHCSDRRSRREVLLALPPDALLAAHGEIWR